MRLQALMSREVTTVRADAPAEAAHRLMLARGIHHLIVLQRRRVVGVCSARDLGGPRGAAVREHRLVAELMSPSIVQAAPTTTVRAAARVMRGRGVGCLPVVRAGRVCGIVTVSDLLGTLGNDARPVRSSRRRPARSRRKESR